MSEESQIPVAPAPWTLQGEGYIFLLRSPFSRAPVPIPSGSYHKLEAGSSANQGANFHGGTGVVMLVRYTSSDVGPYDELLYVPGLFSQTTTPSEDSAEKYHLSITHIYVSTVASVQNGRRNWNIPKHLAKFSFEDKGSSSTLVTVSEAGKPSPVFQGIFHKTNWAPSIPVRTSWLETSLAAKFLSGYKVELRQPPLPFAIDADSTDIGGELASSLVGTDSTFIVRLAASGKGKLASLQSTGEVWDGFGDGDGFPKFKPALGGRGVHMTFTMIFTVPTIAA